MHAHPWHTRACLAALCAMLTLPFLNPHHFNPLPTFYPEWTAAACALLAATLLLRAEVFPRLTLPPASLLPFGLGALALAHLVLGKAPAPSLALLVLLYLLWAVLLLVLGRALADHLGLAALATPCAIALLFGSLLSAFLLACQLIDPALGLGWVFAHVKGGGNLAQANHLANYLWLGLVSALFLFARGTLGTPMFAVCAVLLIAAASLTGSRSVFLYAGGIALLTTWTARRQPSLILRRTALAALAMFLVCLALQPVFTHFQIGSQLQASVAGERMFREVSGIPLRLQLWHTAWALFTAAPWLGNGVGQFPYTAFELAGEHPGVFVGGEHAHNIIMQLLAEYGILGGLLLIGVAVVWWLRFVRAAWTIERLWLACCLLIIAVHSLLEYPLWHTFFLGIAALLLGAGSQGGWRPHLSPASRLLLCGVLLLGSVTLINLGRDYRSLEHTLNPRLRASGEPQDWASSVTTLSALHRSSLFAHYVELVYAFQLTVDHDTLADKITVCEHALRFSPADVIAYKYAYLLALDGRSEEAKRALTRAMASHPGHIPEAARLLADLQRNYPELAALHAILVAGAKGTGAT